MTAEEWAGGKNANPKLMSLKECKLLVCYITSNTTSILGRVYCTYKGEFLLIYHGSVQIGWKIIFSLLLYCCVRKTYKIILII